MITTYAQLLTALDAYGFLPLGGKLPIPTLAALTPPEQWFQEKREIDPWAWRMRACSEKDAAYAHLLFGRPTLVSPAWYGVFVCAFADEESLEERYERGECDPLMRRIGRLFEERPVWARHDLLGTLGRREVKTSQFDRALTALERQMRITVSGEVQRIAQNGAPTGWPSAEYMRVDCFMPDTWPVCTLNRAQAREKITEKALENAPQLQKRDIHRMLG